VGAGGRGGTDTALPGPSRARGGCSWAPPVLPGQGCVSGGLRGTCRQRWPWHGPCGTGWGSPCPWALCCQEGPCPPAGSGWGTPGLGQPQAHPPLPAVSLPGSLSCQHVPGARWPLSPGSHTHIYALCTTLAGSPSPSAAAGPPPASPSRPLGPCVPGVGSEPPPLASPPALVSPSRQRAAAPGFGAALAGQ